MNAACGEGCGYCGRCTGVVDLTQPKIYPHTCDWCNRLIWPGDELIANFGGRFCSDECATLYAEDYASMRASDGE